MIDGNAERDDSPIRLTVDSELSGSAVAAAAIRPGETVLELSSGAGFDSFLAARQTGPAGRVIGVDAQPTAVTRARANARAVAARNVEFRVGELEQLPVPDGSVDVILSTSVSTVSPDRSAVIGEAFRVLRRGGRLAIRSLIEAGAIRPWLHSEDEALAVYRARALRIEEMRALFRAAGFDAVTIHSAPPSPEVVIHAVKARVEGRRSGSEHRS